MPAWFVTVVACAWCVAVNSAESRTPTSRHQVVVYGGTSGGIVAAIQAAKMGKSVVLIEPSKHLGGLTSGGLGATDIGNKAAIGGLSREFYQRIATWYRDPAHWTREAQATYLSKRKAPSENELWMFEPHAAEAVYRLWLAEYPVEVVQGERLLLGEPLNGAPRASVPGSGVTKTGSRIVSIRMESGRVFAGDMFIDATYEGDLMAYAGVAYHVGREANAVYGETLNGVQVARATKHQFIKEIDPYVTPGDPQSGLLPLISKDPPGEDGAGDRRLQAYCFRMCTTDVPENRRAFSAPAGYDASQYELLLRNCDAGDLRVPWNPIFMPNRKTDTNNNFAISTDYIGANYDYPNGNYAQREAIFRDHLSYQQGLCYTLATHPRVPANIREEFNRLGLAKDEFVETDNWSHQMYVREARRLVSEYVMTQAQCEQKVIPEDPVGLGAYNMDSHNCQRYVTAAGKVLNEGDIQVGVSPYRISYRSIRPRQSECENLLVPVCLAASHIAYGSIRMEPVFMVLGQSAATAACLAIDDRVAVQALDYSRLKGRLLADKQALEWTGPVQKAAESRPVKSLAGLVVDNRQATLEGDWVSSASIGGFVGDDYLHDNNEGKGTRQATFAANIPKAGRYTLRVYFTPNGNRATNVPVRVLNDGKTTQVTLDQRSGKELVDGARRLGPFDLMAGETSVVIRNEGTDGYVIVDAMAWELVPQVDRRRGIAVP
jgi:hypothetical protein